MIVGFDFDESTLASTGVLLESQWYDPNSGYSYGEIGTAYPTFTNMVFILEAMHCGGTDKDNGEKGVAAAADGSVIYNMFFD